MSLFSTKFEDVNGVDAGGEEGVERTMDESETSSAAIADVINESIELDAADGEAEQLNEEVEQTEELHDEVEPVVTEGRGLTRTEMSLAISQMRRIAGPAYRDQVNNMVKMEAVSAGGAGAREQTRILFEGIKDTLKSAWEAIKRAFKKVWAKIKTWYIKTFDASKRLKARAEKIRKEADSASGTIEDKTFEFSSAGTLAIDGKVDENIVGKFEVLRKLSGLHLDTVKSSNVNSKAEDMADALKDLTDGGAGEMRAAAVAKGSKSLSTLLLGFIKGLGDAVDGDSKTLDDKTLKSFGTSTEVDVTSTVQLPGGKAIVAVKGKTKENDGLDANITALRKTRLVFSGVRHNPKEANKSVKTLGLSAISTLCGHIEEIADDIFDFKKGWENIDKSQEAVIKEIDNVFREIEKADDDEVNSTTKRRARQFSGAILDIIRRSASFRAALVTYLMTVSGVALTYCEQSRKHYKK